MADRRTDSLVLFSGRTDQRNECTAGIQLSGQKGGWLQPFATMINCSLWVAYGLLKEKRDLPISLANAPGVILGLITFVTAL